ncbi:MAG: hypothetical protein LIO79_09335 [Rikenellaceae bacterium]|nr:hypothetical protein [Rikenellaceae bacterium]
MKKIVLLLAVLMAFSACSSSQEPIAQTEDTEASLYSPVEISFILGRHPTNKNYHNVNIKINSSYGSTSLKDNIALRIISLNTDKGTIFLEKVDGLIFGDYIYSTYSGIFAVQNIIDQYNDGVIYAGEKFPYNSPYIINPDLAEQLEWVEIVEVEFTIQYNNGDGAYVLLCNQPYCSEFFEVISPKGSITGLMSILAGIT